MIAMRLENVGYVVRCMIIDTAKMFSLEHQREATEIWVTNDMEDELAIHLILDGILKPGVSIREQCKTCLLGMTPHWDADNFKLA